MPLADDDKALLDKPAVAPGVYRNPATGETLHVHDVFKPSGGQVPNHPTFRDYGKGQ